MKIISNRAVECGEDMGDQLKNESSLVLTDVGKNGQRKVLTFDSFLVRIVNLLVF